MQSVEQDDMRERREQAISYLAKATQQRGGGNGEVGGGLGPAGGMLYAQRDLTPRERRFQQVCWVISAMGIGGLLYGGWQSRWVTGVIGLCLYVIAGFIGAAIMTDCDPTDNRLVVTEALWGCLSLVGIVVAFGGVFSDLMGVQLAGLAMFFGGAIPFAPPHFEGKNRKQKRKAVEEQQKRAEEERRHQEILNALRGQ